MPLFLVSGKEATMKTSVYCVLIFLNVIFLLCLSCVFPWLANFLSIFHVESFCLVFSIFSFSSSLCFPLLNLFPLPHTLLSIYYPPPSVRCHFLRHCCVLSCSVLTEVTVSFLCCMSPRSVLPGSYFYPVRFSVDYLKLVSSVSTKIPS